MRAGTSTLQRSAVSVSKQFLNADILPNWKRKIRKGKEKDRAELVSHAVTYQIDCKGILAEQLGVCSCPELPEMAAVVEEKLVVLPLEWQVEGGLQVGQTGQVEEEEHRNQKLKHEQSAICDDCKHHSDFLQGFGV